MSAREFWKERGQSLIGVLVASAIMGVLATASMMMLRNQSRATRNVAARGGITDLAAGVDLMFGHSQCTASGSFLMGTSPTSVTVSGGTYSLSMNTMRFPSGDMALTTLDDPTIKNMIQPYEIDAITMTALGGNGAYGSGFVFPFRMTISFRNPAGAPPAPIVKYVLMYTDASRVVTGGCFVGGTPSNLTFSSGQIGDGTNVNTPTGYTTSDCAFMVSPEDTHGGPGGADLTNLWGDGGQWQDNHYGGAQAFYNAGATNYFVFCRWGLKHDDTVGTGPMWLGGVCRYLMICRK